MGSQFELSKADMNLLKSAFKNDYCEFRGMLDIQLDTEGKVTDVQKVALYSMDEAYEDEIKAELLSGIGGTYGKNMYVCRDVAKCNNTKPDHLSFLKMIETVWEDVQRDKNEFSMERFKPIVDRITKHIKEFVPAKKDIPANYVMHIAYYLVNPTQSNAALAKKQQKCQSTCFNYPMFFIWVDAYNNQSVTALVKDGEKVESKRVAYISKEKQPLFTMAYPSPADVTTLYFNTKTPYEQILPIMTDLEFDVLTRPVGYTLECFDSIMNVLFGGIMTYEMNEVLDDAVVSMIEGTPSRELTPEVIVELANKALEVIGEEIAEDDVKLVEKLYKRVFVGEKPIVAELKRKAHKVEFPDMKLNINVNSERLSDNTHLERRETENGVELWYSVKLNTLNEVVKVDGREVILYDGAGIAEKEVDTELEVSARVPAKTQEYVKRFGANDGERNDNIAYLETVMGNNISDAESLLFEYEDLNAVRREIYGISLTDDDTATGEGTEEKAVNKPIIADLSDEDEDIDEEDEYEDEDSGTVEEDSKEENYKPDFYERLAAKKGYDYHNFADTGIDVDDEDAVYDADYVLDDDEDDDDDGYDE